MKVIEFRKEDIWCVSLNIISKFSKEHNNDITLISLSLLSVIKKS